jgi:hypothetical protein
MRRARKSRCSLSRGRLELERFEDRTHPNDLFGLGALPLFGMSLSPLAVATSTSEGQVGTVAIHSD